MARPPKKRRIENIPEISLFKPAGIPQSQLTEVVISYEELESIRLKDIDGLDNEECAKKMHVSRTTFQRILGSARNKIAVALLNGKAIKFAGGNYRLSERSFLCVACEHRFSKPHGNGVRGRDMVCPKCNQRNVQRIKE